MTAKNVGALYRRPDVDTSAYSKMIILEPAVEFSKNWNPRNYGNFGLTAAQVTKIRIELATMAKSIFTKVLSEADTKLSLMRVTVCLPSRRTSSTSLSTLRMSRPLDEQKHIAWMPGQRLSLYRSMTPSRARCWP